MLPVSIVNQFLGLATFFSQAAIAVIILALLFSGYALSKSILGFISKKALLLAFLISFAGVAGSLYYSEFIGFEPCKLCWWQRVFLYPQAVLLGIGLIKKDGKVADHCLVLSVIGAVIASYQTVLQFGFVPDLPCSSSGVSCSQIFVSELGYITIPVMGLTAFIFIIVLLLAAKYKK